MKNKLFEEHYEELLEIMNLLKIGVYITDGVGNTILVNDESCKTGGMTREEVIGKNMKDLEVEGFIKKSVSLKTIASGEEKTMIQDLGDGGKTFVTAVPMKKDSAIDYVVCTERDITETVALKQILKQKNAEKEKYTNEIEYLKNSNLAMSGDITAVDPKSKMVLGKVMRVAGLDTTVLLMGESGTGKEVVANLIYRNSERNGKSFIKVNCAAIPENLIESELFGYERGAFTGADKNGKMGYFELANGGTLFLDEVGELPIHLQSKLLRVLQEREVVRVGGSQNIALDVRVIAATNVDLLKAIEEGKFREDLYYRLNVMPIELLPLRERRQDIGPMATSFAERFSKQYKIEKRITAAAIEALEKYEWPGNVRELQNVIERSIISFDGYEINKFQIDKLLYPRATKTYVPVMEIVSGSSVYEMLDRYEKNIISEMLQKFGSAAKAARVLGMNKATMCRRMQKYGLGNDFKNETKTHL